MKTLTLLSILSFSLAAQTCRPLSPDKASSLVDYFRKQYAIKPGTETKLAETKPYGSACYQELTFKGKSAVKDWEVKMYLSPDGRFLSPELMDTAIDPTVAQKQKAAALMTGLSQNVGTSKGADSAPVTIVEFSDFECPFCKRFSDILSQVLPLEGDQVRVIFHHLPLQMHPWARAAAIGTACAQLQSADAFWAMHDQIFKYQTEITTANIKAKLTEYAKGLATLDQKQYQTCADNDMSLGLVFRDMNLASSNGIESTPTIYVNGHRLKGIKDVAELRELIAEAKAEAVGEVQKEDRAVAVTGSGK